MASSFEGLFVDADLANVAFSYCRFNGFDNHGSFLMQIQDSPMLSIEHSSFDAFFNSSVISTSSVDSLNVHNTTFASDASALSSNQQTRRAILADSTTGNIRDCSFERMLSTDNGGAMLLLNSKMTLSNNTFRENFAEKGGAVEFSCDLGEGEDCQLTLDRNTF